ncbi:hypothetical protein [Leptospira interrogans]|uniref:hypothetical protein n=1 Tax=Leptospira interrogans TaxID=173 RepID=UPI000774646B|nr:hypothetical protein [Leptospira interrogans]
MNRVGKLNTTALYGSRWKTQHNGSLRIALENSTQRLSTDRVVGLVMIGSNALSSRSETLNLKDRFAEFAHPSLTHLIK